MYARVSVSMQLNKTDMLGRAQAELHRLCLCMCMFTAGDPSMYAQPT